MNRTKRTLFILVAAAAMAMPARAYDNETTHPIMSIFAAQKSVLYQDGSIMFNLGLLPAHQEAFEYKARYNLFFRSLFSTRYYTVAGLLAEGSYDEDSDITVRHHFFDPYHDRPLTSDLVNHRSWEWALEEPSTDIAQNWSIRDAKEYLRTGLTSTAGAPADADKRRRDAMRNMFLSLGHAVHHLQDMTQPQHVRDDNHFEVSQLNFWPINLTFNPSRYEHYSVERTDRVNALAAGAAPLTLTADFRIPRDFWFNPGGTGVAQRTNREFLSQGTNFIEGQPWSTRGDFPEPVRRGFTDYLVPDLFALSPGMTLPPEFVIICGHEASNCRMWMFDTDATQRASTLSLFDQDLRRHANGQRLFSLNRFNYNTAHDVLIPRAVSYSAGFVNHFFRGKLDVLAPERGPFAVVDHSSGDGFNTIRARVRNATPNEALSQGTVQAIVKYHRNTCYRADLTGEFTASDSGVLQPPCAYPGWRSEESYVRVTAETSATWEPGETKEMTFQFQEPIPFDATDVILQVYYRGLVGIEENGFALGAIDLSEPTYYTLMNGTDVFELSANGFYYWGDIIAGIANPPFDVCDADGNDAYNTPPDVFVFGGDIDYTISVDAKEIGRVTVPEGRFARFAALVSPFGATLTVRAFGNGFNSINSYDLGSKVLQYDPARNTIVVAPVNTLRSQSRHFNSVTYWHYWPTTGTPLRNMPVSRAADPVIPVQMQMTPQ